MQKTQPKNKETYDVAITGAGLTGLSLAVALQKQGKKVLLLDDGEHLGGANGPVRFSDFTLDKGLRFLPETPETIRLLAFLEDLMGEGLEPTVVDNKKLSYDSGDLKEFLGFGQDAPPAVDEMAYFFHQKEVRTNGRAHHWIQKLTELFEGDVIHPAYVTRFHTEEGRITHLTYNTNKDVYADEFIFCGGIKDALHLFARESIPTKIHQKVAKSTVWTTLCLDLVHTETPAELNSIHVLNHGTKESPEYFVGRFEEIKSLDGEPLTVSHWMTFLDQEVTEDSEQVAVLLKKMKRQLKRVYPELFDKTQQERVGLMPSILGTLDLGLKNPLQLSSLKNFWLGSSQLSSFSNLLGALDRSAELAAYFQNHQVAASSDTTEEMAPAPDAPQTL